MGWFSWLSGKKKSAPSSLPATFAVDVYNAQTGESIQGAVVLCSNGHRGETNDKGYWKDDTFRIGVAFSFTVHHDDYLSSDEQTVTLTAPSGAQNQVTVLLVSTVPPVVELLPLRVESGRFRTDDGWFVPRFYSLFHAIALVRDGNLTELRRLLQRAKDARCNGIEIFGMWHFWGGGEFSPLNADYKVWLSTVVDKAEAFGLYVALRFFCDCQPIPNVGWAGFAPDIPTRRRWLDEVALWAKDRPAVGFVKIANEARKNGWREADAADMLDLAQRFRQLNTVTLLALSDPADAEGAVSAAAYNARQKTIASAGADVLLVHPARKERYAWVDHLKGCAETPEGIGLAGKITCWPDEPMGAASRDIPGRRDSSMTAHVAAAVVGAMIGAYSYMHRADEDDACPGLVESSIAADIPGSPDYKFVNATLVSSPVASFTRYDKVRTCTNGHDGWVVAYGVTRGEIVFAGQWRPIGDVKQFNDSFGCCDVLHVVHD